MVAREIDMEKMRRFELLFIGSQKNQSAEDISILKQRNESVSKDVNSGVWHYIVLSCLFLSSVNSNVIIRQAVLIFY